MCLSIGYKVRIWDARTGSLLHTLQDEGLSKHEVSSPCLSFNGQKIAFVWPNTIEVWDVIFECRIQTIEHNDIVLVALSPTEQKLASGSRSGTVHVWDITSGMLLQTYADCAGDILSLEFSPNGQKLASKFQKRDRILLWDLGSTSLLHTLKSNFEQFKLEMSTPLAFSRSGKTVACRVDAHKIEIWDAESGAALQTLWGSHYDFAGIAFLFNEQHLVSWNDIGIVQLWNVTTGSRLRTFQLDTKEYRSEVGFSPFGQRLASGSRDGNVKIWDAAFKPTLSQKLQGHNSSISVLVFSPDGQKLASLSIYSIIYLWDVATGSLRRTFSCSNRTTSVLFSVDGVKLVCLKRKDILDVWNTESGQVLKREDRSLIDLHAPTANLPYGLSLIDRWITVNEKRLIRVPPDRQGSAFATYGTKVAIGSHSGVVTLLDLNLELMESSIASPPSFQQDIFVSPGDVYDSDRACEEDYEVSDNENSKKENSDENKDDNDDDGY